MKKLQREEIYENAKNLQEGKHNDRAEGAWQEEAEAGDENNGANKGKERGSSLDRNLEKQLDLLQAVLCGCPNDSARRGKAPEC